MKDGFVKSFIEFSTMPIELVYFLPTFYRRSDEKDEVKKKYSLSEWCGAIYGTSLGASFHIAQVSAYTIAIMNLAPDTNLNFPFTEQGVPSEILLVPIITNTLSTSYEIIREKIKSRKRLEDKIKN